MLEVAGIALLVVLVGSVAFGLGRLSRREEDQAPDPTRSLWSRINRLEKEQHRAAAVIEEMNEGVVVVSHSLTPVLANAAARRLLTLPGGELPPTIPSDEVTSAARRCISEHSVIDADLTWSAAGLSLRVRVVPLEPEGAVVFLHDITEELRTQQLRRQFVANASHELKTPVASLQTLVEAIQTSVTDDPETALRFSERMTTESGRLADLIDDLMDLSRVEDPAAMRLGEVDLSAIVDEEAKDAFGSATDAGVELEIDVAEGLRIRGDTQHLHLLVRNLLDNAVRYTPRGGNVSITLTTIDERAHLEVRDTGIGIPLQAQGRVFERFYRVDEDRARVSGGTGLGLSIVKNVAESHAGTVAVASELDEGSTFVVTLPLLDGGGA
jgi:signal transduction histidine kinase